MANNQTQGGQQQPIMAQTQPTMTGQQPTIMVVQNVQPRMQGESCRNNSRIVAWVDIVLGVINIVCCVIVVHLCNVIIQDIYEIHRKENRKGFSNEAVPVAIWVILFMGIFGVVISGVEVYLACCLLGATKISIPYKAIEKAKWWRGYQLFLIVFALLTSGVNFGGGTDRSGRYYIGGYHFVCLLIRCLFVFIVHSFIQELHRAGGGPMMMAGGNTMAYTISQPQNQDNLSGSKNNEDKVN